MMGSLIHLIQTLLAFVVTLAVLILVHEAGHFWMARRLGVKVLRFSIGFGSSWFSYRRNPQSTEFVLAAIPLGGYVRMLDEGDGPVAADELQQTFNRQSLPKRTLIVLAGPLANFLLAFLIYAGIYLVGMPGLRPYVDQPQPGSPAALAGVGAGYLIEAVDSQPVRSWSELEMKLLEAGGEEGEVKLTGSDEAGRPWQGSLDTGILGRIEQEQAMDRLGLRPWAIPLPAVIGQVLTSSPAQQAGLRTGDRILALDGKPVINWNGLVEGVSASAARPLTVQIERAGRVFQLVVTPLWQSAAEGVRVPRIGVSPEIPPQLAQRLQGVVRDTLPGALRDGWRQTWAMSRFTLDTFGRMLVGRASWKNVGGPVQIADYAGQSARRGAVAYAVFLALISISLGVLNLLPIPLLDGGHLMYYAVESIRGSPLSDRVLRLSQRVGMALLAALMGFALYNDMQRLLIN